MSAVQVFEYTVGKGEIACYKQFLLFPQYFLPFWRTFFHIHQIQNCHLQTLSDCRSLIFVVWERVNTLPKYKISDRSELKSFADDKDNLILSPKTSFRLFQSERVCRGQF